MYTEGTEMSGGNGLKGPRPKLCCRAIEEEEEKEKDKGGEEEE